MEGEPASPLTTLGKLLNHYHQHNIIHHTLERGNWGIKDKLDSLKYIVHEQALYTAPSLSALRQPVKKWKLYTEVRSANTGVMLMI